MGALRLGLIGDQRQRVDLLGKRGVGVVLVEIGLHSLKHAMTFRGVEEDQIHTSGSGVIAVLSVDVKNEWAGKSGPRASIRSRAACTSAT